LKFLIDIGHPAHVHYFRNFIRIMQTMGHEFLITARDKEVTFGLLNNYGIKFHSRGKGGKSLFAKLLYILRADWLIYQKARKFKPDLFLSFASTYAAHASKLCRKPHVALDDTEHAKFELFLYPPFTDAILTPDCYMGNLGRKQIRIHAYAEFMYLHRKYFQPDISIKKLLGINEVERFVLFRFISFSASHDLGQKGIPEKIKRDLIKLFENKGYQVRISCEDTSNPFYQPYLMHIPPEKIHDVLAAADFFIGESGTMANEACLLGTPAFFINTLNAGVFIDLEKRGLLYSFRTSDGLMEKVSTLLADPHLQEVHAQRCNKLHNEKIDFTAFLVWFAENYPQSKQEMSIHPEIQNKFN
jgi:predicted glycosyltransferase